MPEETGKNIKEQLLERSIQDIDQIRINTLKSDPLYVEPPAEGATSSDLTEDAESNAEALLAGSNEVELYIPGIFGYIVDADTEERITLSLTPYETAPRLGDTALYSANGRLNSSLSVGETVGNRLRAAKYYTNFMQEVLPGNSVNPADNVDVRFGSKDDRIGGLSRFLDMSGNEQDKSTFMHIVPDTDFTGGKIEIQYRRYDENGEPLDELGTAYVPINFNFVSSKYTLTIKEFIIESVSESSREIYSLNKSFDGYTLRMFGQQPKIINLAGILTNFDDDIIGIDKEVKRELGIQEGSHRDVFLSYYKNFLSGTKCRDFNMKMYFYYNHKVLEGYLLGMSTTTNSSNDNYMAFQAEMIIRREYTTFEAGIGLGTNSAILRNYDRSASGLDILNEDDPDLNIFAQQRSYRANYRLFALKQARTNFGEKVAQYQRTIQTKESVRSFEQVDQAAWFYDIKQFNKTNAQDIAELEKFCLSIIDSIVKHKETKPDIFLKNFAPQDPCAKKIAAYISSRKKEEPTLTFNNLISYCVSEFENKKWYAIGFDIDVDLAPVVAILYSKYEASSNVLSSIGQSEAATMPVTMLFRAAHNKYFEAKSIV